MSDDSPQMNFREWLEEWYHHKGWADDPEKKLAHGVLHTVMAEFDRRFEGPHLGLWRGPIKEVGWTEHYDEEEQSDEWG